MADPVRPDLRHQPHRVPDLTLLVRYAGWLLGCRTMLEAYSQQALDELLAQVPPRRGWDFSCMSVLRQPAPRYSRR
jgi:hypothetical protein